MKHNSRHWSFLDTNMALKNQLPFFRAAEPGRVVVHTAINIAQKIDQLTIARSSSGNIHCLPDVCVLYRLYQDRYRQKKTADSLQLRMRWVYVVPALTAVIVGASEVAVSTVVLALRKSVQIHKDHNVENQKRKWSIALLWLCGCHLAKFMYSLHKNYNSPNRTKLSNVYMRTFCPLLLLLNSKKIHYYSSKPALLFLLSWWIFVATGRFLANFGNITQN